MMPSPAFEYGIEAIALAFMIVLLSGLASMLISKRTKFPYTPLLIFFGILVGPVLHLILPNTARVLFYYIRAFGLFIVMFSAGFQIRVSLLKKHMLVIGLLDTLGLLITAVVAGIIFQFVFHVSWAVGFLFGAIVSGTDPATLIPLFKEHKIDEGIETTILTESIFNGPLAIILTMVAFIFVLPKIPSLQDLISISPGGSLYFVAVIFFIYQIFASLVIAGAFAVVTYYLIKRFNLHTTPYPEILGLGMAFGGYVAGETLHASGFLVVTIIAIILGNHRFFFKDGRKEKDMDEAVRHNIDFNEGLSTFSIIFIFVLLGASLSAGDATSSVLLYGRGGTNEMLKKNGGE